VDQEEVGQWCEGCEVHKGFLESYREQPKVYETVTKLAEQNKGYRVTAVGHSLGGALASLLAVDLRTTAKLEVDLVSLVF
jgi:predicted lipase